MKALIGSMPRRCEAIIAVEGLAHKILEASNLGDISIC